MGLVPPAPGQSDMEYIQGSATAGPRLSGGSGSTAGGGRTVAAAPGGLRLRELRLVARADAVRRPGLVVAVAREADAARVALRKVAVRAVA